MKQARELQTRFGTRVVRAAGSIYYIDYIDPAYGSAFRSGTNEAAETFYLLYQQISSLGNETSCPFRKFDPSGFAP